jgi:hypothetical protein
MSEKNQPKNMMLVIQEHRGMPTFSLIAINETCPYVECIYVPDLKQLAIISKTTKDTFHFLPKIDDNGDVVNAKARKVAGRAYKEERKQIKTYYEYTLVNEDDIASFIEMFAVNSDSFPFKNVMNPEAAAKK